MFEHLYVAETQLVIACALVLLILKTTLKCRYYKLHFTDEDFESRGVKGQGHLNSRVRTELR